MGCTPSCFKLCGERCSPLCLSIGSLIVTGITIGLFVWDIIVIPWGDDEIKTPGKILFYVSFGLTILIFLVSISLLYIRCTKTINTTHNNLAKIISVPLFIISIITIITMAITLILLSLNMSKRSDRIEDEECAENEKKGIYICSSKSINEDGKWAVQLYTNIVMICCLIGQAIFSFFIMRLIFLKSDSSIKDLEEGKGNRNVNVIHEIPRDQLQFTGYDKDGNKIYTYTEPYSEVNNITSTGLNIAQNNGLNNMPNNVQNMEQFNVDNNVPKV